MTAVLYDYWRSTASYRVRIALGLAGVDYKSVSVNLLEREQEEAPHLARNPQGLVPVLEIDGRTISQSLATIEYLDETRTLGLLPNSPEGRARVRQMSYAIAMEIHPICNLMVAQHVVAASKGAIAIEDWMQKFIDRLGAVEAMLKQPETARYCHGDRVTMADICLFAQMYNAIRWNVSLDGWSQIQRVVQELDKIEAFKKAHPDNFRQEQWTR